MNGYNVTFSLMPHTGKEKSLEEICKPDALNILYKGLSIEDIQASLILAIDTLSDDVPKDVRNHLIVSQNLAIYGWFQWNFYTVSLFWSLTSIEMALRYKFLEKYKGDKLFLVKKNETKEVAADFNIFKELRKRWRIQDDRNFDGSFKSLLNWARKNSILPHDTPVVLQELSIAYNNRNVNTNQSSPLNILVEEIPNFRNELAHKRHDWVLLPNSAINGFNQAIEIINRLWPKK
ncbi:MAG: hypothetical protein HY096_11875 [Nitrospinae bacterium]|nr:hypothetical protein [Nitrospinota bacterium]